ncbi:MAG TPA: hypothetical protein DEB40_08225 [Elusimicrobia bacterium]|nr:hypothetical protein [Elusimicrobiota bacterium]HBT61715.1 hypothetical protein [Elusimicrobiota bacterium]
MNEQPPLPSLFQALLRGLYGSLAAATLGHMLVTACLPWGAELWLKGPYGPHFFDISLYLGVLYGGIALSLSRRPGPACAAAAAAFLGIALPMTVLTHAARWGMDTNAQPTLAWYYAVIATHTLATWGTTLGLGALLCPQRRWRGAIFAALGSLAGYLILEVFLRLVPSYAQGRWNPKSFIPSPVDLLTGMLIGAGIGAGIYLATPRPTVPAKEPSS